jgi:hypothetical protein
MGKQERERGTIGEADYTTPLGRVIIFKYRDIRVASLVHAILIIFLAGRCLNLPSLDQNRAFGWHEDVGFSIAIATGWVDSERMPTQFFNCIPATSSGTHWNRLFILVTLDLFSMVRV